MNYPVYLLPKRPVLKELFGKADSVRLSLFIKDITSCHGYHPVKNGTSRDIELFCLLICAEYPASGALLQVFKDLGLAENHLGGGFKSLIEILSRIHIHLKGYGKLRRSHHPLQQYLLYGLLLSGSSFYQKLIMYLKDES